MRNTSAKLTLILSAILILSLPASICLAQPATFEVTGMTCKACVKSVKAKVCGLKAVKKCEVEIGKVILTPKDGQAIDRQEVAKAIKAADENFKVVAP